MTDTPNLALPLIAAAQAQKHVTHNEAVQALDALVQCAVLDRDLAAPPASPAAGDRYIVAAAATGAWAGRSNQVAAWQDGAWSYFPPRAGFLVYVADEGALRLFDGSAWSALPSGSASLQNLTLLGVGTGADAANPFSAKLNGALWTAKPVTEAGTGDLRYTLNKDGAAHVLSFLFQSGYSGRAELGLVGDDDLHLKMSADGTTWVEAIRIAGNGRVGIGTAPGAERLAVAGNIVPSADNAYSIGTPSLRVSTVYAASGVVTTSDIRRKVAVAPLDPDLAVSLLRAVGPIAFRWAEGRGERQFGWSAQDWSEALPEGGAGLLVWADPDDPDSELGLRADQVVALLHAALRTLMDDVSRLSARISALESRATAS